MDTFTKFLVLCLLVLTLCSAAQQPDDLPEGPGKILVEKTCKDCHELDVITAQRDTKEGWTATVNSMRSRGASGTDQDFQAIIEYLTKYLGNEPAKVNVNTASSTDLESGLALESDEAQAIVQYRKDHGDFKDWDSLTKVKGVDIEKLETKKDQIIFDSPPSDVK